MKAESYWQHELNRRDSYKLVSTYYYLPEENTIESLTGLEEALGRVCVEAAEHVADIREETDIDQLTLDYSRLFVGPFELLAPPYGSVYLDTGRRVMGDSTMDVKHRYREVGLDLSRTLKEAPDHIAVELEFMYYLIFKEIEAMEKAELENVMDYLRMQKEFLEDHLGAWVDRFADAVAKNASTDFYRDIAKATKVFVQKDLDAISEVSIAELSPLEPAG